MQLVRAYDDADLVQGYPAYIRLSKTFDAESALLFDGLEASSCRPRPLLIGSLAMATLAPWGRSLMLLQGHRRRHRQQPEEDQDPAGRGRATGTRL